MQLTPEESQKAQKWIERYNRHPSDSRDWKRWKQGFDDRIFDNESLEEPGPYMYGWASANEFIRENKL